MPFHIYTGRAGSGKSLSMAEQILVVLRRNFKYYQKSGIIRPIYSNLKINPFITDQYMEKYGLMMFIIFSDIF